MNPDSRIELLSLMDIHTKLKLVKCMPEVLYTIEDSKVGNIKLFPDQFRHFMKIVKHLKNNIFYVDTSPTGTGKTFITSAIASFYKLPMVVLCPAVTEGIWKEVAIKYAVPCNMVMSYDVLRGKSGKTVSHSIFTYKKSNTYNNHEIEFTTVFKSMLEKGILLVFDEFHHVKNNFFTIRYCR